MHFLLLFLELVFCTPPLLLVVWSHTAPFVAVHAGFDPRGLPFFLVPLILNLRPNED